MAPEVGEEAMRAYAHETNRLDRQLHSSGDAWEAESTKVEQPIAQIIEAVTHGVFHSSLKQTMTRLETRKAELTALLLDAPTQTPVTLPDAASIYARKVAALAEPLNQPEDRRGAAEALRTLIENIVLMPGPALGEVFATLHGEQATIMDWAARQSFGSAAGAGRTKDLRPASMLTAVSLPSWC